MSNEHEQPANSWDDEDEEEKNFRDAYLGTVNQNRPQPRSDASPRPASETRSSRPRPRGVPGSADFYEEIEGDEQTARPRPKRQSRAEVEARLRQRQRQPIYSRDPEESRTRPAPQVRKSSPRTPPRAAENDDYNYRESAPVRPSRPTRDFSSGTPTRRTTGSYNEYREYNDYEIIEQGRRQPQHKHKHKRGGSVFSILLTGCLGGALTLIIVAGVLVFLAIHNTPLGQNLGITKATFNKPDGQVLPLGSATQLIVKDQAGNIAISIDPTASTATLNSVKHVQASNQSDANTQFKQIALSVTSIAQGTDPACLTRACLLINATTPTPATGGGLFGGSNGASIDLTITLPTSFSTSDPGSPNIISVGANAGNINVNSFKGILNLSDNAGDIALASTLVFASTCIQTLHGNITIKQANIFDLASSSELIPCSNKVSNDPARPWFSIKSDVGNVDITLATNLNNLLLDAYTNKGSITDDFNLPVTTSDDSATYHGPLVPNTNPTASLYVAASTGNISLHKQ